MQANFRRVSAATRPSRIEGRLCRQSGPKPDCLLSAHCKHWSADDQRPLPPTFLPMAAADALAESGHDGARRRRGRPQQNMYHVPFECSGQIALPTHACTEQACTEMVSRLSASQTVESAKLGGGDVHTCEDALPAFTSFAPRIRIVIFPRLPKVKYTHAQTQRHESLKLPGSSF